MTPKFSIQMLKTGITSMKVTCHHAGECHAEMMEYASHIRTTCMITPAIAQQDSVEGIVKLTLLVNQRIAMEENVYLRLPTLWTLSVFVPLEGLECSVKQVGTQLSHGLRQWTTLTMSSFPNCLIQTRTRKKLHHLIHNAKLSTHRIVRFHCKLMEIWNPKLAKFYKEMYARGQALALYSYTCTVLCKNWVH